MGISQTAFKSTNADVILNAHSLMLRHKSISPYEAWIKGTFRDMRDLPGFLGLSLTRTDFYLANSRLSPPVENVRNFCLALGIHPADLQPGLIDEDCSYHYPVVQFMLEMMKDEETLPQDKEHCREALKEEQYRFLKLQEQDNKLPSAYMQYALANARRLQNSSAYSYALRQDFNHLPENVQNDIKFGLDLHEEILSQALMRAYKAMEKMNIRCREELTEQVRMLYGDYRPREKLDFIADEMKKGRKSKDDLLLDWHFNGSGVLCQGKKSRKYEADQMANNPWVLHADHELRICRAGLSVDNVKESFLMGMPRYINFRTAEYDLQAAERAQDNFRAWRLDPAASARHLPLFANFSLIQAVLQPETIQQAPPPIPEHAKQRETLRLRQAGMAIK